MADAPIASLDEPIYAPSSSTDHGVTTEPAHFSGTDLPCWEFTGSTAIALRDRLSDLTKDPDETGPCTAFPGPQPISIDRGHFDIVRRQRYAISLKTDGVRACMVITDVDGVHIVALFDRSLQKAYGIFIQNVPRVLYQVGSILDGEVVFDARLQRWTFVVFDCFMVSGFPQYQKNLWDRLHAVRACLRSYEPSPADTLVVHMKSFTSLHDAPPPGREAELQKGSTLPTDGYVLMPVDQGIVFGHHPQFFKLKTCHSVDFVFQKGSLLVFNHETKRLVKAGILASIPSGGLPEGAIVECTLHQYHQQPTKRVWTYVSTRVDKTKGNTLGTLNKTLLNMEENLGYRDIRALAPVS